MFPKLRCYFLTVITVKSFLLIITSNFKQIQLTIYGVLGFWGFGVLGGNRFWSYIFTYAT